MIRSIIFDLGGVLIDWNPRYLYRKLLNNEEAIDFFLQHICTGEWNEEQDAGRSLAEGTDLLLAKYPEHANNIRHFYGRWTEMLSGAIEGAVDIFRALKESEQYTLYALTNWSAETFPIALQKYEFLHWFDGVVVSGTEKDRKPFATFYQVLLKRYAVLPEEALFIDDNARNVTAAINCGLDSILFVNAEQLREELLLRGIHV